MMLSSGGTGARRRIFAKSKVRGAPATVYVGMPPGRRGIGGSWITVSSCVGVGTWRGGGGFGCALVVDLGVGGGAMHHCSICRLFRSRIILIRMTIFTSPPELASHHRASALS